LVESDGRVREDAAVERGASFEGGMGPHQKDSLEVRGGSGIDKSSHLPEDVGSQGAAAEKDMSSAAHDDITADLEDEDVGGGPVDGDASLGSSERYVGHPCVHARLKGMAGDEAALEVCCAGRASRRVGIRSSHVADGSGKHGRRRRRVAGPVAEAVHLRRRGVGVVG